MSTLVTAKWTTSVPNPRRNTFCGRNANNFSSGVKTQNNAMNAISRSLRRASPSASSPAAINAAGRLAAPRPQPAPAARDAVGPGGVDGCTGSMD